MSVRVVDVVCAYGGVLCNTGRRTETLCAVTDGACFGIGLWGLGMLAPLDDASPPTQMVLCVRSKAGELEGVLIEGCWKSGLLIGVEGSGFGRRVRA